MSVIGQTRPLNIVTYPLNSVIGSGGAPRFGFVERDRGVILESGRMAPQYTDYYSNTLEDIGYYDDYGQPINTSNMSGLGQTRVPGNVLSPALPEYLRNALLPLDTWQRFETEREQEEEIMNLEDGLQKAEADARAQLKKEEQANKISKWNLISIAGVTITLIAVVYFIYKRKG